VSFPCGFIVIDKPSGVASSAMVSLVRRLTGVRRVGHVGTLDPLATGVLPVAVGHATRLVEYLDDTHKAYVARVRFGESTTTGDAEGDVTARGDASALTADAVRAALPAFIGEIEQRPPLFSAIKLAGKPLYRYARAGEDVAPEPRRVRVHALDLRSFEPGDGAAPEAEVDVRCGRGTYVRSLARDLGEALGVGAHLVALRRTASAGFTADEAHPPQRLEAAAREGRLESLLIAPDRAVEDRPAAILDGRGSALVTQGRELRFGRASASGLCRAYDLDGRFLGLLASAGNLAWRPLKVFQPPC